MTARRLLAHAALGVAGGAIAVVACGVTISVADWQRKNHIAQRAAIKRGKALQKMRKSVQP